MSQDFSWSYYDFSKQEGIQQVRAEEGIDEVMESALLDEDSRPRALVLPEGVLVILRGVNLNPGSELEDMISIRVWARPGRVVSTGRAACVPSRRWRRRIPKTAATLSAGWSPSSVTTSARPSTGWKPSWKSRKTA